MFSIVAPAAINSWVTNARHDPDQADDHMYGRECGQTQTQLHNALPRLNLSKSTTAGRQTPHEHLDIRYADATSE